MKEAELIKMRYDLKLTQQALVVALEKIKALEEKVFENNQLYIKKMFIFVYNIRTNDKQDYYKRNFYSLGH